MTTSQLLVEKYYIKNIKSIQTLRDMKEMLEFFGMDIPDMKIRIQILKEEISVRELEDSHH